MKTIFGFPWYEGEQVGEITFFLPDSEFWILLFVLEAPIESFLFNPIYAFSSIYPSISNFIWAVEHYFLLLIPVSCFKPEFYSEIYLKGDLFKGDLTDYLLISTGWGLGIVSISFYLYETIFGLSFCYITPPFNIVVVLIMGGSCSRGCWFKIIACYLTCFKLVGFSFSFDLDFEFFRGGFGGIASLFISRGFYSLVELEALVSSLYSPYLSSPFLYSRN